MTNNKNRKTTTKDESREEQPRASSWIRPWAWALRFLVPPLVSEYIAFAVPGRSAHISSADGLAHPAMDGGHYQGPSWRSSPGGPLARVPGLEFCPIWG